MRIKFVKFWTLATYDFRKLWSAFPDQPFRSQFFPRGGGGLAESEISLSEKTEIFLDFFFWKGGGPTYSKRVLS